MTKIKSGVTPGKVASEKSVNAIQRFPIAIGVPAQKTAIHLSIFDALPDSAYIRESQLVQSPDRPDTPVPLPFSAPTLWRKVKAGTFPKPVKLSERVTAWHVGTVRAWLTAQATVGATA